MEVRKGASSTNSSDAFYCAGSECPESVITGSDDAAGHQGQDGFSIYTEEQLFDEIKKYNILLRKMGQEMSDKGENFKKILKKLGQELDARKLQPEKVVRKGASSINLSDAFYCAGSECPESVRTGSDDAAGHQGQDGFSICTEEQLFDEIKKYNILLCTMGQKMSDKGENLKKILKKLGQELDARKLQPEKLSDSRAEQLVVVGTMEIIFALDDVGFGDHLASSQRVLCHVS